MSTWFKENYKMLSLYRADKKEFGFYEVENRLSQPKNKLRKVKKVKKVPPLVKNLIVRSESVEEEKLQMIGQNAVCK